MWAVAKIQHLKNDADRLKIIRNLSRILDIRVIDVDVVKGKLYFKYNNELAFNQAKLELRRIGYPLISFKSSKHLIESPNKTNWA